jgi:RimJ/RimL family protein N-acetyltransferase
MTVVDPLASSLARALPDLPEWVETRGMLLSGWARIAGGTTVREGFVVAVLEGALSSISIVGCPEAEVIRATTEAAGVTIMTPVICQREDAEYVASSLPGWTVAPAIVHTLGSPPQPSYQDPDVRLLDPAEAASLNHVPDGLRYEITHALELAPVASAFADGRPVAFCYPCWRTETLWDVSIDALEGYRRRGLAERCARFMIDHMRRQGRQAVWGALASNTPSLNLAKRLGFEPVGEVAVASRGPWTFFSRGFDFGP